MVSSRFGFATPKNCLWHSHKSISRPKGISMVSSTERWSCAMP